MKLKDEIARLRKRIPLLRQLAMPDVDNFELERLLDFTDAAVAIVQRTRNAHLGRCLCEEPHFTCLGCAARDVLALLDKETE